MLVDSEGFRHELWWLWCWWASWDSNEVNLKSPFLIFLSSQVFLKPVALTYGCTLESPCLIAKSCLTLCCPWAAARQAPLSFTISWSLLDFMSIESVILSNHLTLCHPLLPLPSIFPSIWVFSNELARWTKVPLKALFNLIRGMPLALIFYKSTPPLPSHPKALSTFIVNVLVDDIKGSLINLTLPTDIRPSL